MRQLPIMFSLSAVIDRRKYVDSIGSDIRDSQECLCHISFDTLNPYHTDPMLEHAIAYKPGRNIKDVHIIVEHRDFLLGYRSTYSGTINSTRGTGFQLTPREAKRLHKSIERRSKMQLTD